MTQHNTMKFSSEHINAGIIITQADLRGFFHPLGCRMDMPTAKYLHAIPGNLIAFAAGCGNEDKPGPEWFKGTSISYEDLLAMCQQFAADCHKAQKEAIQLIIWEILAQHAQLCEEVAKDDKKSSVYLKNLDKENSWGRTMHALIEAFYQVTEDQLKELGVEYETAEVKQP